MKMKVLISTMLLGVLFIMGACTTAQANDANQPNNQVPPAPHKYLVTVSGEDFSKAVNIAKQVEVNAGDIFTVALDSNATTGFQWTEQANITDLNVLKQTAHQYVEPRSDSSDTPVAGMAGMEEWTFKAEQTGSTTVNISYDRPWEGGEKGVRTFTLTVVVK